MRIESKDTCCVVVDYQEKLMPIIADQGTVLSNSTKLLEGLRLLEIPLLVTAQYAKGLGINVAEIRRAAGTEEFFDKKSFSFCGDEKTSDKLKGLSRKNVIVCGIEAHICVLQSVIDLAAAGYQPILVEDCIGSRRLHDKEIAVERARAEGAIVTTYESLLFELTMSAEHGKFKQISNLVK